MIISLILLYVVISFIILVPINKEIKMNLFIILGIAMVLIAGIGSEGLTKDYDNYLNAFNSQNLSASRMEPTFHLITLFIKSTLKDPIFLFLTYALIGVTIKFIAIRQLSSLVLLSVLIYLSNFFILHEMTQIRIGVASAFLLLSIKPLFERNLKKFLLFTFLAISFHYSAIIFLPFWFLHPLKFKKQLYLVLIPLAYVLVILGFSFGNLIQFIPIPQIQTLYLMYKTKISMGLGETINLFNTMHLLRCSIALLMIYKSDVLIINNKYSIILIKIYVIGLTSFVIFSDLPVVSFRISELLSTVEIILIPFLVYLFGPKKLAVLVPILVGALMLYVSLFHVQLILE